MRQTPGRRIDAIASKEPVTRWGERTGEDHLFIRKSFSSEDYKVVFCTCDEFAHELGVHVSERRGADDVENDLLNFSGPVYLLPLLGLTTPMR